MSPFSHPSARKDVLTAAVTVTLTQAQIQLKRPLFLDMILGNLVIITTASYQRHFLHPFHFCIEGFRTNENVCFPKKHSFFILSSNFSNVILSSNFSNVDFFLISWRKRSIKRAEFFFEKSYLLIRIF